MSAVSGIERRAFQRMKLSRPILAMLDHRNALILDIGISGALVEHHGELHKGDEVRLSFRWQGEEIEFIGDVVRSVINRGGVAGGSPVSHTGIHFLEATGASEQRLQEMMASMVARVLAAQKSNSTGREDDSDSARLLAEIGEARRMRTRGFLRHRLIQGGWKIDRVEDPAQPKDGFTVGAYEDEEELEALCRTYETADEAARAMIRLVAELSVRNAR